MAFSDRSLDSLSHEDLLALVAAGTVEQESLEFKLTLPGGKDEDRKEFLADVVSLANAHGGHIVYGMREERGAAVDLVGLRGIDQDKERRRLDQIIRDGVEPRLTGVASWAVPIGVDCVAIVLRVPRSWARPHLVKANSRFYRRASNGRFPMTHADIKQAMLESDAVGDRLRQFRKVRIDALLANEGPTGPIGGPMVVLHLLPVAAAEGQMLDLSHVDRYDKRLDLMAGSHEAPRYNFDGYLVPGYARNGGYAKDYVQVFRSGALESVAGDLLDDQNKRIPTVHLAERLMNAVPRYLEVIASLGASPPVYLALSMLRVKGYRLAISQAFEFYRSEVPPPIDRDIVPVPEIQVDDFAYPAEKLLRPVLDVVWNAGGYAGCLQYDEQGVWHRDRP